MALMFEEEKGFQDNAARKNFVFMAYPFTPPLPQDDYRAVTRELEAELPIRLWYFLDEVTTSELMRKVWRAILRSDLSFFDISGGNPNVAFELGLAAASNKSCMTLLLTGQDNPLGRADLGYSERAEYTSRESLKVKLKSILTTRCSAMRIINQLSYKLITDAFPYDRAELENRLLRVVNIVFRNKRTTRSAVRTIIGNDGLAGVVLTGLRQENVLQPEGAKRHAKWVFSPEWVHHDHEVSGE